MDYYSALEENEILICAMIGPDVENSILSEKGQSQDNILYDFIYVTCSKEVNL